MGTQKDQSPYSEELNRQEPNAVTYAAMEEAEQMDTSGKSYVRVNDLISALEKSDKEYAVPE